MNRKLISTIKNMAAMGLLCASTVHAEDLFKPSAMDIYGKSATEDKVLQHLMGDLTTASLKVVDINHFVDLKTDKFELTLGGVTLHANKLGVEQTGTGSVVWTGELSQYEKSSGEAALYDAENQIVMVRNGSMLTGNARVNGELFKIRPLQNGGHAIVKVDESARPDDHPPEFMNTGNMTKGKPDGNGNGNGGGGNNGGGDTNPPDPGPLETIRVMVHYTPAVANATADINGLIDLAIAETNAGYQNSGVVINMQLAGKYMTNYSETGNFTTDLGRYRTPNDGYMDEIHGQRDQVSADMAIVFLNNTQYCGLASAIGSNASTAFASVYWDCATGYYSFGHEFGHLQSARHDPRNDPSTTPYAYGHGYQQTKGSSWRTIMAYNCSRGGCPRLNYWSNPYVDYTDGKAMGTTDKSHNARVLNETKANIASFR